MIDRHLQRIIIRWWREGLTIQEIQELTKFAHHDDITQTIGTYETQRKAPVMSIFTSTPENVDLQAVRHDYANAFASDPDDIDLRAYRFDQWLKRHDMQLMGTAWAEGVTYGINATLSAAKSVRVNPVRENPYLDKE
ncbi:hypothetical protein EMO89_01555 [Bifidobacterium tissieri]|uniref:Uncharacterized protein n=1 Tax=Bifidobacterium tissieri TaxID=1630162 RepID=A0A5M9ZVA2_9BIFI|nr:hypothetical protein [Bifidobacterium tissieri]KAA8831448.1 hypothetical protein EMO89_01555 [Bifidobacterium tissieri]